MIRFLLGISRAPFLPLSLLCALLGIAAAHYAGSSIRLADAVLVVLAAVLAHASVNAFNEYFDFRSGLDLKTVRTPFSGGSGSLPAAPGYLHLALGWAVLTLVVTVAIGLYFIRLRGWMLGSLGAMGGLLVIAYTPLINRWPWTCLLAPGIGFGPVLVLGSSVAAGGSAGAADGWSAAIMAVMASGLLLANQQPDVEADRSVGRRHLTIAYGEALARRVLVALWCLPAVLLALAVSLGQLPPLAALAIFPAILAIANALGLWRLPLAEALPLALLGRNVVACLAMPLCLAVALLLAA